MVRALLKRFIKDQQGLAAVEFALTAPLMIMFYLGLVEVCSAYMAQKRAGHATSMVADLAAQQETLTTSNLTDITNIGALIMKPFSATPLTMRVSQVTLTGNTAKVDWSWSRGMTAHKDGATLTLPAGLLESGQSVIVSESTYAYQSPVNDLLPGVTNFKAIYYLRPRAIDKITCSNCPKNP